MPTLNSFISPSIFSTESTTNPLYAGMIAGATYAIPTFTGASGAASNDPGGLYGWLMYSRTQLANPVRGTTSETYIEYSDYNSFINDLNLLSGITYCLVSRTTEGGTQGFFSYAGTKVTPRTNGYDFLHALNYLSYGGSLVIAGTTTGLKNYLNANSYKLDILMGQTGNTATVPFVRDNDYIFGVFASSSDGAGFTAINYDSLMGPAFVPFSQGATASDRIFNVGAQSFKAPFATDSLISNTTLEYTISSVSDVAGAFTRSKNTNSLPLTVAGSNFSTPLNTKINNIVDWSDEATKNIYKKNRVNFYTKIDTNTFTNYFLGSDLVGATAGAGATYTSSERVGPAYLQNYIQNNVNDILLKYIFAINNSTTRSSVSTEIGSFILSISQYIDPTFTQIICDTTNNTDNSATLSADVTVKPILSTTTYTVTASVSNT
jgi:hypothetical protein